MRELIAEGRTTPVASVRAALDRLQSLSPSTARNPESLTALRPAGTAVRSGRPTLCWSAVPPGGEVTITILQPVGRTELRTVWEGRADSGQELTLPDEADLQPGSYLWQVVALTERRKVPSDLVGFVVLKETARRDIEGLESKIGNAPLLKIGLYEAYGLYEEALQQAETLLQRNAEDETARRIHGYLLSRLSGERRTL